MRRRAARAEAEAHAGLDQLERLGGSLPLQFVRIAHNGQLGSRPTRVNRMALFRRGRADDFIVKDVADRHLAGAQIDAEHAAFALVA